MKLQAFWTELKPETIFLEKWKKKEEFLMSEVIANLFLLEIFFDVFLFYS